MLLYSKNSEAIFADVTDQDEKPNLAPWQLEDAERLGRLFMAYRAAGGLKQEEFAAAFGLKSQGNLGHYLHGRRPLNITAARNFARGLRQPVEAFSPTLAQQIADAHKETNVRAGTEVEFVDVKRVDVLVGAGHGLVGGIEESVGSLKFARAFLRSIGVSADRARIVNVKGPSMEPTIKDGAVLLVSLNNTDPRSDTIFALSRPAEGLIVKRLVKVGKQWLARSDNREFADIPIGHGEPITIIGRAHWMGVKL